MNPLQRGLFDPPEHVRAEDGRRRGRRAAEFGIGSVSRRDAGWIETARRVAREIAARKGTVCSDDLHDACPPPPDAHPNLMGAVWRSIGLPAIGWTTSRRPEAHGRAIRLYGPPR